jgi:hypothetical protein
MDVFVLEHPPLLEVESVTIQQWQTRATAAEQIRGQAHNGRREPWIGGEVLLEKTRVRAEAKGILHEEETLNRSS